MKALLAAIYSKFSADTGVGGLNNSTTGLTGGLHNTQAPASAAFPFGVMTLVDNTIDGVFGPVNFEECRIRFSLYSDNSSASTLLDLFEALKTLYDDVDLSVTGYGTYRCRRDVSNLVQDDQAVWGHHTDYRIGLCPS